MLGQLLGALDDGREVVAGELPDLAGETDTAVEEQDLGLADAAGMEEELTGRRGTRGVLVAEAEASRRAITRSPACASDSLILLGWTHEFHVADVQRRREFVKAHDRRVSLTLFEAANVLLAEPGNLGQLLLRQAFLLPDPPDVSPDQPAHVHAPKVSG